MTAGYDSVSATCPISLGPADASGRIHNGTSSKSSGGLPLNCSSFENVCDENRNVIKTYPFPMYSPVSAAAMGLLPVEEIPIELDVTRFYETRDLQTKKSRDRKDITLHMRLRRLAQNRASQRAYRDRRDKKMREIEEKLTELQGRHDALTESYEALQLEYSVVKEELESLRSQHESGSPIRRSVPSCLREWDESGEGSADPLMFDASVFCYDTAGDWNNQICFQNSVE